MDDELKLMTDRPDQYDFPNSYILSRLSAAADRERVLVEALREARAFVRSMTQTPDGAWVLVAGDPELAVCDLDATIARALTQEPTR